MIRLVQNGSKDINQSICIPFCFCTPQNVPGRVNVQQTMEDKRAEMVANRMVKEIESFTESHEYIEMISFLIFWYEIKNVNGSLAEKFPVHKFILN